MLKTLGPRQKSTGTIQSVASHASMLLAQEKVNFLSYY